MSVPTVAGLGLLLVVLGGWAMWSRRWTAAWGAAIDLGKMRTPRLAVRFTWRWDGEWKRAERCYTRSVVVYVGRRTWSPLRWGRATAPSRKETL